MRKIKQFILFLIIFSSFGIVNLVKATEIEPVTNLYDFSDYFDRDYSKYANSTWSGAYYRVGIMGHKQFIEFEIKSSYTKEHKLYGWTKLSNTEKNDYTMRYYIKTVNSYCYNDNTFGDVNHLYQLNYTLKSFE